MSWPEMKKAINSYLSKPLNEQLNSNPEIPLNDFLCSTNSVKVYETQSVNASTVLSVTGKGLLHGVWVSIPVPANTTSPDVIIKIDDKTIFDVAHKNDSSNARTLIFGLVAAESPYVKNFGYNSNIGGVAYRPAQYSSAGANHELWICNPLPISSGRQLIADPYRLGSLVTKPIVFSKSLKVLLSGTIPSNTWCTIIYDLLD